MNLKRIWNPTNVLSALLLAIMLGALIFALDWRYKFSYSAPPETTVGDLGFRYRQDQRACRNSLDEEGRSKDFLGECGRLEGRHMRRVQLRTYNIIASLNQDLVIEGSFIEWLSAQVSRWENVHMLSTKLWDSEFQHSVLENVVFDAVDLRGVSFREAKLVNVTFRNAKMMDMSFRGARLQGVKFENTTCQICDFSGADMGDTQMDLPFQKASFSLGTRLPFPYEQVGKYGFELRD